MRGPFVKYEISKISFIQVKICPNGEALLLVLSKWVVTPGPKFTNIRKLLFYTLALILDSAFEKDEFSKKEVLTQRPSKPALQSPRQKNTAPVTSMLSRRDLRRRIPRRQANLHVLKSNLSPSISHKTNLLSTDLIDNICLTRAGRRLLI